MAFPNTTYPTTLDSSESRTDYLDTVYDDDFNYHDDQIMAIQTYMGVSGTMIGAGVAGKGPSGMISPKPSGDNAFTLAARAAFSAGYLFLLQDDYDVAAVTKFSVDCDGFVWSAEGFDASSGALVIPEAATLPAAGTTGRIMWDSDDERLYYDDSSDWIAVDKTPIAGYLEVVTNYSYTQLAVPVEEEMTMFVFDASDVIEDDGHLVRFQALCNPTFGAAGSATVKLYDFGPSAGPPIAETLIATLTWTASGIDYESQGLTIHDTTPSTNQIVRASRLYRVTVYQSSQVADDVYVGSTGIRVEL